MTEDTKLQPWELAELPLHRLLSLGRKLSASETSNSLKIAVLGDAATQHYCQALSATLKLRGHWPHIFEAEYDTLHQEIRDSASGLFAHQPDFVILFTTTQALWAKFATDPDKTTFAARTFEELESLWGLVTQRTPATIIQHNFVVPINRPFGNGTSARSESFAASIANLNALIAGRAALGGVKIVDTEFQASYFGKRHWLDERLWCQARQALSPAYLPPLAKNVSDVILTERGTGVKCVILDLDNTLWGGILADDGMERIEIGQTELGLAFARFQIGLRELRSRGILLAACSKNDQDNVLNVLENHPDMILRREDFAVVVANFGDKVSNIMQIKEVLNIGYDSMVFLDDTSFERSLVRSALPEIQVPELPEDPAQFIVELARWNLFEGRTVTAEDRLRSDFYRTDVLRSEIRQKFAGLDGFIADLEMTAEILPIDAYTRPRALQLIQRSNQFNLTTLRHSDGVLEQLASSSNASAFCIRLRDRLGDNGIVSVVILRKIGEDAVIDTWIMSCRVLGRRVEDLTVREMVREARGLRCDRLVGRYTPTSKNGMVANLFPVHGFHPQGADGATQLFSLPLDQYAEKAIPIAVQNKVRADR